MISPKIGGIVLIILPIIPLIMSIRYNSTNKQKYFEVYFLLSTLVSIIFSFAYSKLLGLPLTQDEKIYYSDFVGNLFLNYYGNIVIPLVYLLTLLIFYFIIYKRYLKQ